MSRLGVRVVVVMLIAATTVVTAPAATAAGTRAVTVDLRPGSPNAGVNLKGNVTLPVAILSTPGFDARTVVASSVCFGDRDNAQQRDCTEQHGTGHRQDVDRDRDVDLLFHFDADETGLDAGDTQGCLNGRTTSGDEIYGCDAVEVLNGVPEADLPDFAVALTADRPSADPHATVQWTAVVTNEGVGASTVWPGTPLLRFTVPAGVSVSSVTPPAGYGCAAGGGGTHDCTPVAPDTIAVGASRTFVLTGVLPDAAGVVNLSAQADPAGAVAEVDETDNVANAPVDVLAANLAIALGAVPGAASPGEQLVWTATVANTGPGAARLAGGFAVLRLDVPAGLGGTAVQVPAGYACSLAGSTYTCRTAALTTLAVGAQVVVALTATAPATPGSYEVVGTVDPAAALAEVDENDNVARAAVLVQLPNLVAGMTAVPDPVGADEVVEWTASLTNAGPGRATVPAGGPVLRLTSSVDLVGAAVSGPAGFTCAPTAAREFGCTTDAVLTLAAGAARAFTLRGSLPAGARGADATAAVDPAGLVVESDETDNTASSSVRARLSDLVTTIDVAPNPVDAFHSVSWTAHVRNGGTDAVALAAGTRVVRFSHPSGLLNLFAATPTGYSCFISAPQVVDCATSAATSVAPGATLDFTLGALAPKEPGIITTTATADPLDLVTESDETNNSASAATTVQPPDLSVAVSATPNPVDALASVTFTGRITNDGPAAARILSGTRVIRMNVPAGLLNLAVNTPTGYSCFISAPEVVDCTTSTTVTLAAGAFVDIALIGLAPRQPGPITATMTADPLDVIPEGDETDNAASATVTVQPPDFSVSVTGTPDPVDALASASWTARVTNDGPANARLFANTRLVRFVVPADLLNLAVNTPAGYSCFISAPQTVDCSTSATTNIGAGAFVDVTLLGLAPRTPGPLTVTVTADPLGAIPEGDETDNTASASITVQPPDFSITLTPSASVVDALHSVSWTARVTNDGPANARLFANTRLVRFVVPADLLNLAVNTPAGYSCFISAPQTVDCSTSATTNIGAGAFVDVTLLGLAPRTAGPATVTASADPLDAIPEGDETDNTATSSVLVRIPDLAVGMTAPSPVAPGATVTYSAVVTNDGPAVARLFTNVVVLRMTVPAGLGGASMTAPAGYSCAATDATTFDCRATTTANLAVGSSLTFALTGTAPSAPATLTATATADATATVPETDEADNAATTSVTVA